MTSKKAGAASLSKVRRPAAPVPAGKHSTGVAHCRPTRSRVSSVSGSPTSFAAVLFALAFFGLSIAAIVGAGVLADLLHPLACAALGTVVLGVVFALMLGGEQ